MKLVLLAAWCTQRLAVEASSRQLSDLLEQLDSCSEHVSSRRIGDCMNLAPAGTGSVTLATVLKQYSNYSHHNHDFRLPRPPVNGKQPACFILTVREPVSRLESLLRYARQKSMIPQRLDNASGDAIVAALMNVSDPNHAHAMNAVPNEFWFSQMSYIAENTCAAKNMEVGRCMHPRSLRDPRPLPRPPPPPSKSSLARARHFHPRTTFPMLPSRVIESPPPPLPCAAAEPHLSQSRLCGRSTSSAPSG